MPRELKQEMYEDIAAISAFIRRNAFIYGTDLADRLDAAWKRQMSQSWHHREMEELIARHEREVAELKKRIGNAAAMRTAIVDINVAAHSIITLIAKGGEVLNIEQVMQQIIHITDSALSAPARNCDKYATADEALKAQQAAFDDSNFENGECKLGCPECDDFPTKCEVRWLFAPAEKGGAE